MDLYKGHSIICATEIHLNQVIPDLVTRSHEVADRSCNGNHGDSAVAVGVSGGGGSEVARRIGIVGRRSRG